MFSVSSESPPAVLAQQLIYWSGIIVHSLPLLLTWWSIPAFYDIGWVVLDTQRNKIKQLTKCIQSNVCMVYILWVFISVYFSKVSHHVDFTEAESWPSLWTKLEITHVCDLYVCDAIHQHEISPAVHYSSSSYPFEVAGWLLKRARDGKEEHEKIDLFLKV